MPTPKTGCVVVDPPADDHAWFHWNTPLHRALWLQQFDVARFLIRAGATVDSYNAVGRTALHEAVWNHSAETVSFLIQYGANLETPTLGSRVFWKDQDRQMDGTGGFLALHYSLIQGDLEMMDLLLHGGADLSITLERWSFLDLAVIYDDDLATQLLMEFGARLPKVEVVTTRNLRQWRQDARLLLELMSSSDAVPESRLRLVYLHVLSTCREPASGDLEETRYFLQRFKEELHALAGEELPKRTTNLCLNCSQFYTRLERPSRRDRKRDEITVQLHESRSELVQHAASGCSLCMLVADGLDAIDRSARDDKRGMNCFSQRLQNDTSDESVRVRFVCDWRDMASLQKNLVIFCGESQVTLKMKHVPWAEAFPQDREDNTLLGSGSARAFWTARAWLQKCKTSAGHRECQEFSQRMQIERAHPKRLLDVGKDFYTPVLIENVDTSMPYLALSYCWGAPKGAVRTTKANINKHKHGIKLEKMPATVRDAVIATRALGFRYIWIDALCIIQDDPDDWSNQAAMMHSIYLNAEITLSSLTAKDCADRMFRRRPERSVVPVPLNFWLRKTCRPQKSANESRCETLAVFRIWNEEDLQTHGPVHERGWTFQEQLLSSRMLHFAPGSLHWECLCSYATETDPTGALKRRREVRDRYIPQIEAKRSIRGFQPKFGVQSVQAGTKFQKVAFTMWQKQVQDFTSRKLTKESDRLPAFTAISKHMENIVQGEFIAGIWKGRNFIESLCWSLEKPATTSPPLPSWTWLYQGASITFHYLDTAGDRPVVGRLVNPKALNINVDPQTYQVTGSLQMQGYIWPLRNLKKPKRPRRDLALSPRFLLDCSDTKPANCYALDLLSLGRGPPYKGLGHPLWPGGRPPAIVFMLLEEVNALKGVFRRVGVGSFPGEDDSKDRVEKMPGGREQIITII